MRRHLFRTAAVCGLAGLAAAIAPATAAFATPRVDLGTYDSHIACDVDASSNNQLGYSGTFSCARGGDGRIHQFYTAARAN